MTFFLASPIYRTLQVQSIWQTSGKLLEAVLTYSYIPSSLNYVLKWNWYFLNCFFKFGPSFGTHDSFTILSFLIMSIFSFSFTEVLLFIYSLVTFSKTVTLCPFSSKTFIKNFISWAIYFSEQICSARDKNSLTPNLGGLFNPPAGGGGGGGGPPPPPPPLV